MKAYVVKRSALSGFLTRSYKCRENMVKRGILPRLNDGETADAYGVDFAESFVVSKPQTSLLEVSHERAARLSNKSASRPAKAA